MFNYENVLTGILLVPVLYLWRNLYETYLTLDKQYKEDELFHEKHNCVVMYSRGHMRGWPPNYDVKINTTNLDVYLEPYLYFIHTAKSNLNVAMMRIAINPLFDALHEALERGVKVKLIVNFLSVKSIKDKFKKLIKSGAQVAFYIDRTEQLNYIMHCKYMVKDFKTDHGYLCMGSLNFTSLTAMLNNFEDVTFTSNPGVVEEFNKSFAESWNLISQDNTDIYNKSVLSDYGLLE